MKELFVVAGLGNPGEKYEKTKHNIGFEVLDCFLLKYGGSNFKLDKKHRALLSNSEAGRKQLILAKPQTYMNLSGESIRSIVNWYKIPTENVIIIYDDIDLMVGRIRIKPSGSAGTHNGMRSIVQNLSSTSFPRIRVGIGRPNAHDEDSICSANDLSTARHAQNISLHKNSLSDYVLTAFNKNDSIIIEDAIVSAADAVLYFVENGIEAAMNKFNPVRP